MSFVTDAGYPGVRMLSENRMRPVSASTAMAPRYGARGPYDAAGAGGCRGFAGTGFAGGLCAGVAFAGAGRRDGAAFAGATFVGAAFSGAAFLAG